MQKTIDKLAELQERFKRVRITDTSSVFNTDLLYTMELGHGLNVAECMAHSAMARKESRGAHQRLDEGCTERYDVNFLKDTLAELGHGLNVAECMAHSAMARKESRGAHQRLDEGCTERYDVNFLKDTLAFTSVWTKVAPSVTTSTSSKTPSPSAMLMARLAWSTAT